MRARISIAHDGVGILAIRDAGRGEVSTVTNDAEAVVAYLHARFNLGDRRLVYEDTEGRWDEVVHHDGHFISFVILGCSTLEAAMAKIRPQTYSVEICSERGGAYLERIYSGASYQEAFDFASGARSRAEWRGRWIKFQTPEATRWAEIR